ncbi:MAG: hypothetical protein A3K19_16975 [Lentisphaerae bacterium RIFOXYB12_FULL_65_16]|nr:MAG: hypothetical protein A3K18_17935 [Lentisphaerae bacterium RIFOXYA12_64_32]OGV88940.1 MAG: hypothetical protein A3K19_16975 [Lentisphaerae bacterium RIFOXYB12_FULL_65_16]
MDILLIRHGDPDYTNDTITPTGRRQAELLSRHLLDAGITHLYCSPMGRARDTLRPTAEKLGLPHTVLPWLRELNGCYDGKHWCWSLPGAESLDLPQVPDASTWHTFEPYGPHMQKVQDELGQQFDAFLAQLGYVREGLRYRVECESRDVLAFFCHAGLSLTLLGYLFRWPLQLVYSHLSYDPTGVTRLTWETWQGYAVPRAKTINDLAHLARPGTE